MEIIISKNAGFCFGVNNAVEKTKQELEKMNSNQTLYCLGELVHNKQTLDKLVQKGLKIVEDINSVPDESNLIIRAHGVAPYVYEVARKKKINIIDLTCPKVSNIHKIVSDSVESDTYIVIIGIKVHPEIIGTKGFAKENSIIIQEEQDIEKLKSILKKQNERIKKICVFSQTTFSVDKFSFLASKIEEMIQDDFKNIELEIKSCICNSTNLRQDETKNLCGEVELMIVVGGKNSSNTEKLYTIAKENSKNCIWIENKDDLDMDYMKRFDKIAITTGASTSIDVVNEIVDLIERNQDKICKK